MMMHGPANVKFLLYLHLSSVPVHECNGGALRVYDSLIYEYIHLHSCVIPETLQIIMHCLWWMAVTSHHGRKLHCIVTHPVHLALLAEHLVTKLVQWPQFPFMINATFCVHIYEVCAESFELQVQLPIKIVWWPYNYVWFSRQSATFLYWYQLDTQFFI